MSNEIIYQENDIVIASVVENNEQPVYVLSDVEGDELKYFPQNLSPEKLIAETIGYHNAQFDIRKAIGL